MKRGQNLEKEEILRAVVIVDDFDEIFGNFLKTGCSALLPLASRTILDYTLGYLSQSGVQETILFCCTKVDAIRDYAKNSPWSQPGSLMKVSTIVSEQCICIGDVLRDIDSKGLIKSDFILASACNVSNINLQEALKYHKSKFKKDKNTAMTLILQDRGASVRGEEHIVAVNSDTDKLLIYTNEFAKSRVIFSKECIDEHPRMTVYSCLRDTGVAICSPSALIIFSDNFDFQTKEDFIREILNNEEVQDSRIYCHIASGYGSTVRDWASYQKVTQDVIRRWTYPFVPDVPFGASEPLIHQRSFIYKHSGVNLSKGCKLEGDIVIGKSSVIGSNTRLIRCVIGDECIVGDNVTIQDSYLMNGGNVKNGAKISLSVLGEGVTVSSNASLKNCQIHHSVILPDSADFADKIISSKASGDDSEKIGTAAFILCSSGSDTDSDAGHGVKKTVAWLRNPEDEINAEEDEEEEDDDDALSESGSELQSRAPTPEPEDIFYSEVLDSLQRGYEESLPSSNLILEINSSRHAYNILIPNVTRLTSKAIFTLPSRIGCAVKPLLDFFKPLFGNYVKKKEGQLKCLEGFSEAHESLGKELITCIHHLYDTDVLSEEVIEEWYDDLEEDDVLKKKVAKFVQWLKEAAEESDEE